MGCCALLQGIFPTKGLNPHLLLLQHWQVGSFPLALPGKPLKFSIHTLTKQWATWFNQKAIRVKATQIMDFSNLHEGNYGPLALEKEMAVHSSVLAWRVPGTVEPGGLPSVGSQSRTRLKRLSSSTSNPMDGGAWWAAVHEVVKSWTRLSDFTFTFHCHALEKEMATCSSVLVWRIPGTVEPGGLPSMGLHRVGHNWSDLAAAAALLGLPKGFNNLWKHQAVICIFAKDSERYKNTSVKDVLSQ